MERTQDFDVPAEELWEAVTDPQRMQWLGDDVSLEVRPGGTGRVTDGDETRAVVVDEVEAGHRLSFRWWPEGDEDQATRVELIVLPRSPGSRLVVRESLPAPVGTLAGRRFLACAVRQSAAPTATAAWAWDRRLLVLGLATLHPLAPARVGG